jgi:excisionase family DNA binding protein
MDEVNLPKRVVLTIDELAQALAVTPKHIRDLIELGRLKAIDIGTRHQEEEVPRPHVERSRAVPRTLRG